MQKRIIALLAALAMLLGMAACGGGAEDAPETAAQAAAGEPAGREAEPAQAGAWSIYWYLCGSDLETEGGFATDDLGELLSVQLPEGVNVVIETGGSAQWQNDFVDAGKLQRFVYNSEGLTLVDEQPLASMGEAQTLADFLRFAKTSFPADKTAVVFWNHGGGSVSGAAFDELYENDSLTLDEMYAAFGSVWEPSMENPPLELVGFDTCLMATVDVAYTFSDLAHYLVASEETEPANGWLYSGWAGALARDDTMDGAQLGRAICDSYYQGCEETGTQDNATLSVTDLTQLWPLLEAYEAFGAESLAKACTDTGFFSEFARAAQRSENYGGNTREQGYTNMVDLGHLARQSGGTVTSAQAVLDALDACVLYRVNGQFRKEATGLSCYYSYNGDMEDLIGYTDMGASTAFKYFYTYELTGTLDEAGMEYVRSMGVEELPEIKNLTTMGWDNAPLDIDENGVSFMTLGPDASEILAGIGFSLYYIDEENDIIMFLGADNDIISDWENGVFHDNFRGVWGSIDGSLVYMELSFEGEDYNLYSVPVLLNGEECNLQVAYDFTNEAWYILGARQGIDESGMADKELRLLEEGDELTTLWYMSSFSGDDDFAPYANETITVTASTAFAETPLLDGSYMMYFEMWDAMGNYAASDIVLFAYEGGDIYTTVYE